MRKFEPQTFNFLHSGVCLFVCFLQLFLQFIMENVKENTKFRWQMTVQNIMEYNAIGLSDTQSITCTCTHEVPVNIEGDLYPP